LLTLRPTACVAFEGAGLATSGLLEMWIDDTDKHVWYLT
jgi:hypothetical protein